MPCLSYEDNWARSSYDVRSSNANTKLLESNDKLARIACNALTAMENGVPLAELLKNKEIAVWWRAHKMADTRAQKEKAKAEAEKKAKAEALAKLTPVEIEALGLNKKGNPRRR